MKNSELNNRQEVIDYCNRNPEEFVKRFLEKYDLIEPQRGYLNRLSTKDQRVSHIKQLINKEDHE
ncbi:hypothetical protein ACKGJO_10480 [Gracilimonas sp. Q87]|uniref:hypothetical protein n=1 Tax=Gracilimonas sp. Q87 TaxID=3384766 RepID=UPI0039845FDD